MSSSRLRVLLPLLVLVSWIGVSSADLNKLDPRVRIALARVKAGATVERMRQDQAAVTSQGDLDVFIRGPVTRAELQALGVRVRTALPGLYTANIPVSAIEAVAALPGVLTIRGSAPCEPELDVSVPASMATGLRGPGPAFTGLNGAGVLIGDVDSGVDWTHGDFKNQAGNTRLITIWDQTDLVGPNPVSYAYGTEWSSSDINASAPREFDGGNGHGTHVMGIAGGDGSQTGGAIPAFTFVGMAPMADLVMVKTDFQTGSIVDGVAYCDSMATARGQSVVVNLSLGSQFGPHDGTSDFESALGLLTGTGKLIVKSAGNDRGLARHASIPTAARDSATMSVAGSATSRLIAIDGYYANAKNFSVIVRTPNNTVIGPITKGSLNAGYPGTATTNGVVYVENGFTPTLGGDPEVYIEINVNPGQTMNGSWTFTFVPVSGAGAGDIDLWRYFSSAGVVANFVRNNAPNQELITEPGNSAQIITAGAYVTKDTWTGCNGLAATYGEVAGNLGTFSSPGPTRDGRVKPDLVAPGSAIGSATSDVATQICPGGPSVSALLADGMNHIVMEGTSMAAPHVTGALALLMQNFGPLTVAQARAMLAAHATVDGSTGAVPNNNWGYGKLHLDTWTGTLLSMFVASPTSDGIELRWQISTGSFASVTLERADHATGPWMALTTQPRDENGVTVVVDRDAVKGHTYWYRLRATTDGGALTFYGPLSGTAGEVIVGFELQRAAPNPTPGPSHIGFTLPRQANVWLGVVDVMGREVAVLVNGVKHAGRYEAVWNGAGVPAGLYFIRYRTPEGERDQRVAIVH